jgi:hypothetical protein
MTTAFPTLIEEGRKYGVDVTVAHQIREQLDDNLRELTRAVGNMIVFRVTAPNAGALAKEFRVEIPEPSIERLQPAYEIVAHPLDHLVSHPVRDPKVMDAHRETAEAMRAVFEEVFALAKRVEEAWRRWQEYADRVIGAMSFERAYPQFSGVSSSGFDVDLDTRKKSFSEAMDSFLYRAMLSAGQTDEEGFTPFDWESPGYISVRVRAAQFVKDEVERLYQGLIANEFAKEFGREIGEMFREVALIARCSVHLELIGVDALKEADYAPSVFWKYAIGLEGLQVGDPWKDKQIVEFNELVREYIEKLDAVTKQILAYNHLSSSVVRLAEAIANLAYQLHQDPILTTSGHVQPIPDKPRLYSDVQAEMANRLTSLDNFHAWCKLETEAGVQNFQIAIRKLVVRAEPQLAREIKRRSQLTYGAEPQKPQLPVRIATDEEPGDGVFGEKKLAARRQKSQGR